jgi:hypothetical protein
MSGVALVLSAVLRRSSAAVPAGFATYIMCWALQLVVQFGFPYRPGVARGWVAFFSCLPPCLLTKGLQDLANAALGEQYEPSQSRYRAVTEPLQSRYRAVTEQLQRRWVSGEQLQSSHSSYRCVREAAGVVTVTECDPGGDRIDPHNPHHDTHR